MAYLKRRHSTRDIIDKGNKFYEEHDYLRALECYEKAIESKRRVGEAIGLKGKALRELGKPYEAIQCFNESKKLDKKYTHDAYIEIAYTYVALGELDKAEENFDRTININKDDLVAWNGKGLVAFDRGRYHDAILHYRRAIGKNHGPEFAYIFENIGSCYYKIGEYRLNDAIDRYEEAHKMNPESAGPLIGLGKIFLDRDNRVEAEKKFAEALKIDPDYVHLEWIAIGVSFAMNNEYDNAIQYFKKVIDSNSVFKYHALINMGLICFRLENFLESIDYFEQATHGDLCYNSFATICKLYASYKSNKYYGANDYNISNLQFNENLNFPPSNSVVYLRKDGAYAFIECYDIEFINNLVKEIKEELTSDITDTSENSLDGYLEDIASNGFKGAQEFASRYPERKLSRDDLLEAKRIAQENGLCGEKYINNFLGIMKSR